jgi:PAS domain S-box-containing protein
MFTPKLLDLMERLAESIATALAQRQARESLCISEEKYRTLFEESFDGLFITSPDGRILDMNKKLVSIFGYETKDEILKLDLERDVYVNPADRTRILAMVNTQGSAEYEVAMKKKNGMKIVVHCSLTAVKDERGEITTYRGILRDITERKQAEQDIALLSFALNNVHEAAFLIDEKARFQFVNEESCRALNYTRSELLSLSVQEVDLDFPVKRWTEHWSDLKEHRSLNFESRHRTRDGRIFPVEIYANYFEFGGKAYNLALVRDITERHNTKKNLLEYQKKLQSLISQISIAEEKERKRIAENLHDRLGQSMVLAKMKMDLLDKSGLPPETGATLREIGQSLGTLIHTTQSITYDLSNPVLYERGLGTAIEEWIQEEFTPQYKVQVVIENQIQELDLPMDQLTFVYRAVRELLVNVAKHAQITSANILIQCHQGRVQITVSDKGRGFDPGILQDRSESKKHFGLFSIRERLEYLGGSMKIHSQQGGGTQITLELPDETNRKGNIV